MYICVYFGEKPLFLCDSLDPEVEPWVHHDDAVFIDELDAHTIKSMIHEMEQPRVKAGVFLHPDLDELKKQFFRKFTGVTAAGGLVTNEDGSVLLIFRRGKWDLPKGKQDPGESLEACALREVEEETGLKNVERGPLLTVTFHTYHEGTRFILKDSHWYQMQVRGKQVLRPQTEEDIHDIRWVSRDELPAYLPECFPSVRDVLRQW